MLQYIVTCDMPRRACVQTETTQLIYERVTKFFLACERVNKNSTHVVAR
jgi:hypothetical protein